MKTTTQSEISPGVVVKVRNWPDTQGDRFLVYQVVDVHGSEWPRQVYAHRLEKGSVAGFRAFPLEHCRIDPKATKLRRQLESAISRN